MDKKVLEVLSGKIQNDPYARFLGIELIEINKGYSKLRMQIKGCMNNFVGIARRCHLQPGRSRFRSGIKFPRHTGRSLKYEYYLYFCSFGRLGFSGRGERGEFNVKDSLI